MRYRNFDIELYEYTSAENSEEFSVRVTSSPAGDKSPSQAERVILPSVLRLTSGRHLVQNQGAFSVSF